MYVHIYSKKNLNVCLLVKTFIKVRKNQTNVIQIHKRHKFINIHLPTWIYLTNNHTKSIIYACIYSYMYTLYICICVLIISALNFIQVHVIFCHPGYIFANARARNKHMSGVVSSIVTQWPTFNMWVTGIREIVGGRPDWDCVNIEKEFNEI